MWNARAGKKRIEYGAAGPESGAGAAMGKAALSRREAWGEGRMGIRTPDGLGLARLALVYRRAVGPRRIEGTLSLRKARREREE